MKRQNDDNHNNSEPKSNKVARGDELLNEILNDDASNDEGSIIHDDPLYEEYFGHSENSSNRDDLRDETYIGYGPISLVSINLLNAAKNGDSTSVISSLDEGADIEARDDDESTALILAAKNGHTEVVKLLLGRSAKTKAQNEDGEYALSLAAESGNVEVVKSLLDLGVDVDQASSALAYAIGSGQTAIMKLIFENVIDIEERDSDEKNSDIVLAIEYRNIESLKFLLERNYDLEIVSRDRQKTVLMEAVDHGSIEAVELLLSKGAKVDLHSSQFWDNLINDDLKSHIPNAPHSFGRYNNYSSKIGDAYHSIKSLLLIADHVQNCTQKVLVQDNNPFINLKCSLVTSNTKNVIKTLIFNKINASFDHNEISKVANKVITALSEAIITIKDSNEENMVKDNINELQSIIDEVKAKKLIPIFGEYDEGQSNVPKLSLLALTAVSNQSRFKEILQQEFVAEKLTIAIKSNMLNDEQIVKIHSIQSSLNNLAEGNVVSTSNMIDDLRSENLSGLSDLSGNICINNDIT